MHPPDRMERSVLYARYTRSSHESEADLAPCINSASRYATRCADRGKLPTLSVYSNDLAAALPRPETDDGYAGVIDGQGRYHRHTKITKRKPRAYSYDDRSGA